MATLVSKYETFKVLSRLLMEAAGIPEDKRMYITAITCRCAVNEFVSFTIEKLGDEENIAKAVDANHMEIWAAAPDDRRST